MDLTKQSKLKALVLLFALTLGLMLALPQFAFAAEEPPATIDYTIKKDLAKGMEVDAKLIGWVNLREMPDEDFEFNATLMNAVIEKMNDKVIAVNSRIWGLAFKERYVKSEIPSGANPSDWLPAYGVDGVWFNMEIQLLDSKQKRVQYAWWEDYFPVGYTLTKDTLNSLQTQLENYRITEGTTIAGRYKSKGNLSQSWGNSVDTSGNAPLLMLPYTVQGTEDYKIVYKADYQLDESAASAAKKDEWVKGKKGWWYSYANDTYAKGHTQIGGKYYFFDNDGWMKTGWQQAKGNSDWYYFGGANDGVMKTNKWVKSGKSWYYLDSDGKMLTGLKPVAGKIYHFADNGAMTTGWKQIGSDWYYFGGANDGVMKTSKWVKSGSKWYYLDAEGKMLKGLKPVDGKTYYFSDSGAMQTGWKEINKKWYYFGKANDGVMKTNKWIGNYWLGADGVMATDTWVDGDKYKVDVNGKWIPGAKK